ncbi:uncharacterized protein LOC124925573 [Impatiens glandulifera]|uniref:uncharacterized protein LOC124925573 n=1 Tax=Impatiens glandulifera TaxID=253017 RepID=UPI001FB11352|nr:uncharacterized protein LOC124925573 [Impatiens glandulifera]
MSFTIASLSSPNPSLNRCKQFASRTHLNNQPRFIAFPLCAYSIPRQSINTNAAAAADGFPREFSGCTSTLLFRRRLGGGFCAVAGNGETENTTAFDKVEEERRRGSTMPERFRYLTKEAPDRPVRWPWLIALVFLLYAWRATIWELHNWKQALASIAGFFIALLKLALAIVLELIGDPIISLIRGVETSLYAIRAFYSGMLAYTPVGELTKCIILASAVLAIGEAVVPDSVNRQPYLITAAGLFGYAAVRSYISEPFFWTLLFGLFGYARIVKKRDLVSSLLPGAAVMAAVGQPWVRVVVIASYAALAVIQHSRNPSKEEEEVEGGRKVPVPLLCAAMAIGIRVAAKWAGYRHLRWMVA